MSENATPNASPEPPATPATPAARPPVDDNHVPYARFSSVVQERNSARDELEALRAQLTELRGSFEHERKALSAEIESHKARALEFEQTASWRGNEVDLARRGVVDPEMTEFVRFHWNKVSPGEDGAKPEFSKWADGFISERPYLTPASVAPNPGPPPKRPPPGNPDGGAKPVTPGRSWTPEELANMSDAEYRQHRAEIKAAVRNGG